MNLFVTYKKYFISGGIFVAVLGGYFLIRGYVADIQRLAKAEGIKEQTKIMESARQADARQYERDRAATQKQIADLTAQQAARDKDATKRTTKYVAKVAEVKTKTSTDDIIKQLQDVLKIAATNAGNNQVTMPAEQAQGYTLLKLELDQTRADLADLRQSFVEEQQKRAAVEADRDKLAGELDKEKEMSAQYRKQAEAFEKAAHKSKLRRVFDTAKPVAITIGAALIAQRLIK